MDKATNLQLEMLSFVAGEIEKVSPLKMGSEIARQEPETMEDSQQSDRELYDDDRNNLK